MQAYTYSIKHIPSNAIYYGSRKSSFIDIGISYFSSSKLVKRMIQEEGIENFEFKIRRKFNTYEDARSHETNLLQRINAIKNRNVLNQAISSPRICSKDSVSEQIRRQKISKRMKEVWKSPEYIHKQLHLFDKEKQSNRGKLGAMKRAENYVFGKTKRKNKNSKYGNVTIMRNGITKIVKSNQVPAYKKIGWTRI